MGTSATRKAFRGDMHVRPDPMYDQPRPGQQQGGVAGQGGKGELVLGGRGLKGAGKTGGGTGGGAGTGTGAVPAPDSG